MACSAVDLHTADHIFSECLEGMFANKAVVLVTHQLQFIRRCAKVAIVDGGTLHYFGPFNAEAQRVMARYLPVPDEDVEHVVEEKKRVTRVAHKLAKVRTLHWCLFV
jgi:ABC-type methionine transport system ATPase subunit